MDQLRLLVLLEFVDPFMDLCWSFVMFFDDRCISLFSLFFVDLLCDAFVFFVAERFWDLF
jgi:hypothetical protein